jgi:hypothetical protein
MKLKIYHLPLVGLLTFGLGRLYNQLPSDISSLSDVWNKVGSKVSTFAPNDYSTVQLNSDKVVSACSNRGIMLDKIRDYSTGITYASLPKGGYIVSRGQEKGSSKVTYAVQMQNFGTKFEPKEGFEILSCGKINFKALKRKSVLFANLDPKKFSFTITSTDNINNAWLEVKDAEESRVYIAFVENQAPVIVRLYGRNTSIQNFGDLNKVRIASFDISK